MKAGERVRIFGLVKAKKYNGYEGVLVEKLENEDRWSVRIDIKKKKKKKLSLKTRNLALARTSEEPKEDASMLRRIVESVRSIDPREVLLDGVFKSMMDPRSFRKNVFPFVESNDVPGSLLELLVDEKYRSLLIHIMPRVRKKAESIVEGANRRARESGDLGQVMPSSMVWHVTLEGFARELIGSIKEYTAALMRVHNQSLHASPDHESATCAQFDEETLSSLERDGFAVQDDFFGADWTELLREDAMRFCRIETSSFVSSDVVSGIMSQSSHGCESERSQALRPSVTVLREKICLKKYPALAEALDAMSAFPHELNKRVSSFRLAKSIEGDAMICRFKGAGCHEPWRLDSSTRGQDNGFRVSFVYYFSSSSEGCDLVLKKNEDDDKKEHHKISAKADRLVIYRSDKIIRNVTGFQPKNRDNLFVSLSFYVRTARLL